MTDGDHERDALARARQGAHDAFVLLYRQDAPPAWRLALALTADAERAADAVAEGFRRALAPRRAGTAEPAEAFLVQLLAATRHAALDGPTAAATALAAPPDDSDAERTASRRSQRAAEVMAAFGKLPERWRTILWLLVVEGVGTLDAARILGCRPEEAEDLAERAQAGLRERWIRDQRDAGVTDPVAPDHLDRQLQPVLPLPLELFDLAEARWRATRRREPGPLRLVLPGGRPLPRWAERSLVGATAALVAAGIASAVAVESDPDHRTGSELAAPAAGGGDRSPSRDGQADTPTEPRAYMDDGPPTSTASTSPPGRAAAPTAAGSSRTGATSAGAPVVTAAPTTDEPTTTTTAAPLLQATVGAGSTLGLSVGDRCTGVEVLGTTIGCPPETADEGLTLDVDSALLGS